MKETLRDGNTVALYTCLDFLQVAGIITDCFQEIDVHIKSTTGGRFTKVATLNTKVGTHTIAKLVPFKEYDVKATVRSPDGRRSEARSRIKTAEDGMYPG
jgi:hypothetical protein